MLKIGLRSLNLEQLWVIEGEHNDASFFSIDGKKYSLYIDSKRPEWYWRATPYELFIEDEFNDV
jgi:hypothetical protein